MATHYPLDCENEVLVPNCDPCWNPEYGRIGSFAFLKSSYTFVDQTSAAEWNTAINNQDVLMFPMSSGELGEPSPITGPGYARTTERLLGYDFEATLVIPQYTENANFVNSIIGRDSYKLVYNTSSQTHISPVTVTIVPLTQIADDLSSEVTWKFKVKWKATTFPVPFDTPAGVFDQCYDI